MEDVVSHRVDNDSLVVTNLVLKINDALVFEVSLEEFAQTVNLPVELALVVIVLVVFKERLVLRVSSSTQLITTNSAWLGSFSRPIVTNPFLS